MPATISFEIELALSGTVYPGRPEQGPTYSSGGEPAEYASVDDIDIEDFGIVELDRSLRNPSHPSGCWRTTSLLDGIDRNSPEIQKLFANILALRGEDAEEAILSEEERWAA
jgi:hypothetical protein